MPEPPGAPIRARIISNPGAGAARGGDVDASLKAAVGLLAAGGWTVDWRRSARGPGVDARALAAEAADAGYDVVLAAGGDGTVNELANALAGRRTALGVLPCGTANVLAAQLGLVPMPSAFRRPDPAAAAAALLQARVQRVDLGWARPWGAARRHFLLWAGIGLDAAITDELEGASRQAKRRYGALAFGTVGLRLARSTGPAEAIVRRDGVRSREPLVMALAANIALYAGTLRMAPGARMDDGRLDLAILAGEGVLSASLSWLLGGVAGGERVRRLGALLGRGGEEPRELNETVRRLRIVSRPRLPVHVDAEPCGRTPVDIGVRPGALRLLVPDAAPPALFSLAPEDDLRPGGRGS